MASPDGVKQPRGDAGVWLLLMQKQPDDASNEPPGGFYMRSWCLGSCTFPPRCPGNTLKDTEEKAISHVKITSVLIGGTGTISQY